MSLPLKEEILYKEKSRTSRTKWQYLKNYLEVANNKRERCLKVRGNQSLVRINRLRVGVESWNTLRVRSLDSLSKAHSYLLSG